MRGSRGSLFGVVALLVVALSWPGSLPAQSPDSTPARVQPPPSTPPRQPAPQPPGPGRPPRPHARPQPRHSSPAGTAQAQPPTGRVHRRPRSPRLRRQPGRAIPPAGTNVPRQLFAGLGDSEGAESPGTPDRPAGPGARRDPPGAADRRVLREPALREDGDPGRDSPAPDAGAPG